VSAGSWADGIGPDPFLAPAGESAGTDRRIREIRDRVEAEKAAVATYAGRSGHDTAAYVKRGLAFEQCQVNACADVEFLLAEVDRLRAEAETLGNDGTIRVSAETWLEMTSDDDAPKAPHPGLVALLREHRIQVHAPNHDDPF
jgi:hypothetical protein